jgi:hypothetical protein
MDRIGLTWPNSLPIAIYAQILRSSKPEEDFCVPMATLESESDRIFDGVRPRPGAIFILRREWWESKTSRKSQARGRLEDGVHGGWNMSSSTHPAVRNVIDDPQNCKLVVDYMSRRKGEDPASTTGDDGYQSDTVPISAGLKRHEIFLVPSGYNASVAPADRQPLPSVCLIHYVQDDAAPDPRVMFPQPPIMILRQGDARGALRLALLDKPGQVGVGGSAPTAAIGLADDIRRKGPDVEGRGSSPLALRCDFLNVGGRQPLLAEGPGRPRSSPSSGSPNPVAYGCSADVHPSSGAEIDGSTRHLTPAEDPPHRRAPPPKEGPHSARPVVYKPTSYFLASLAHPNAQVLQQPTSSFSAAPQCFVDLPGSQQSERNAGDQAPPAAHMSSAQAWRRCGGDPPLPTRAAPEWMLPVFKRQRNALPSVPVDLPHSVAGESASVHPQQPFEQTTKLTSSISSIISDGQIDRAMMQLLGASTCSTSSRAECGLRYEDALKADFLSTEDVLDSFADVCSSPSKRTVQALF